MSSLKNVTEKIRTLEDETKNLLLEIEELKKLAESHGRKVMSDIRREENLEARDKDTRMLDKETAAAVAITMLGLAVLAYYVWTLLEGTIWKWV